MGDVKSTFDVLRMMDSLFQRLNHDNAGSLFGSHACNILDDVMGTLNIGRVEKHLWVGGYVP